MLLPRIAFPVLEAPPTSTPMPVLCAIVLPSASTPTTVLVVLADRRMPGPPFPSAVPVADTPIRFCFTTLAEAPPAALGLNSIPPEVFPEMRLPSAAAGPPNSFELAGFARSPLI